MGTSFVHGRIAAHRSDADATPTRKLPPKIRKSMVEALFRAAHHKPMVDTKQGLAGFKGEFSRPAFLHSCKSLSDKESWHCPQ
jgi:hypothetical protein